MFRKGAFRAALIAAVTASAVAVAAPATANVQVGSSGWEWGNPLPQGNTLRSMSFAGATGYAAGDFGTLLKTTDGGTTWSGLPVGTFQGLSIVQAVGADVVVAGGGCVARRSVDGGETFTAIAFTPVESSCRAGLADMAFVSADLGFLLLEDGSVFTTTDGGTQFAPRTALPGTRAAGGGVEPRAIAFTAPANGFAATSDGKIFETTDAGVSWRVVAEAGRGVAELSFAGGRGYAVGNAGLVLRSDDGGRSWRPRDLGVGALDYTAIHCATPDLCVLSTGSGAQLVRTTDGGETRGSVITPSTDPIHAAAFASPTRVAAAGAMGSTVVSDDAGATFAPIGGRLTGAYLGVRAGARAGTAFAPGRAGALARTVDSGRTWVRGNVPTTADLIDVSFPDGSTGYALDADGGLFRTGNGGETWRTLGTGSTARLVAVHAPGADVVVVAGPRGVRRSTDAGETFSQVRAGAARGARLDGLAPTRGSALLAWGRTTLIRSSDGGRSWSALALPGPQRPERRRGQSRRAFARALAGWERVRTRIAQVSFSDGSTGLLRGHDNRIWRTTNAGRSWTPLPAVGTERIQGMAVSSGRAAYLVTDRFGGGEGGYLLRTVDGGTTWQPQFVVSTPIQPTGVAASGSGVDYLLGGETGLLASTTGGVAGARSTLTLATRSRMLRAPRSITVTGRLRPAGASERVTVSMLAPGRVGWRSQTVDVAANGSFVSSWRVQRGTSTFVAQWSGDFKSAGAGSRVLEVTVRPPPRRARRGAARGRSRR